MCGVGFITLSAWKVLPGVGIEADGTVAFKKLLDIHMEMQRWMNVDRTQAVHASCSVRTLWAGGPVPVLMVPCSVEHRFQFLEVGNGLVPCHWKSLSCKCGH